MQQKTWYMIPTIIFSFLFVYYIYAITKYFTQGSTLLKFILSFAVIFLAITSLMSYHSWQPQFKMPYLDGKILNWIILIGGVSLVIVMAILFFSSFAMNEFIQTSPVQTLKDVLVPGTVTIDSEAVLKSAQCTEGVYNMKTNKCDTNPPFCIVNPQTGAITSCSCTIGSYNAATNSCQ